MSRPDPAEFMSPLQELNRLRVARVRLSGRRRELELLFERSWSAHEHLGVYGSLAPGEVNHSVLSRLGGTWTTGLLTTGDLIQTGWGAAAGYPALRWRPAGPAVGVSLLVSVDLVQWWDWLDELEGTDYVRVLVPVHDGQGCVAIANLYEASRESSA